MGLTPEQWERATSVFEGALGLRGEARDSFLREACGADASLRAEVEAMLRAHEAPGNFLDEPILSSGDATVPSARLAGGLTLERIGHFRVRGELGQGGMGVVYRAEDERLGRPAALKVLKPGLAQTAEARQRLLKEARAASALDHPNLCTVYEIEETADGRPVIVMAYYDGETLRQRLARGPLSPREALQLMLQAAQGLASAHEAGIVHRDIKPANLMVTRDGVLKILDFGIATVGMEQQPASGAGAFGTVAYLAPEQARGETADHRIDIWALGVVFYEVVSGRHPFRRDSSLATLNAILYEDPAPLEATESALPLWPVLTRALSKDPGQRYHTMREFCGALEVLRDSSDSGSLAGTLSRMRPAPSVAVLPFANLSADPENDYLAAGLAEELAHALSGRAGLRVVSRSAAEKYGRQAMDPMEAGRRLKVGAVVEGSIRREGQSVRVAVQPIHAADGYHLWSGRYDRELRGMLALQEELAEAIAAQLVEKLAPGEPAAAASAPPLDTEACEAYLRGLFHLNQWTPASLERAAAFLEKAAELSPSLGKAHTALGRAWLHRAMLGFVPPQQAAAKAAAALQRGAELEPAAALPRLLATVARSLRDWNWEPARAMAGQAWREAPRNPELLQWYCEIVLLPSRRLREAASLLDWGSEDDPPPLRLGAAWLPLWLLDPPGAVRLARRSLELAPAVLTPYWIQCLALEAMGDLAGAVAAAREALVVDSQSTISQGLLARALALNGQRAGAEQVLASLEAAAQRSYVAPTHRLWGYAALGDLDRAFALLREAVEVRDFLALYASAYPMFAPLRADPRFQEFTMDTKPPS